MLTLGFRLVIALGVFILAATSVSAQEYFNVAMDSPTTTMISGVNNQDRLLFAHSYQRSYCCDIQSDEVDVGAYFYGLNNNRGFNFQDGFTPRGSTDPVIPFYGGNTASDKSRACFVVDVASSFTAGLRLTMAFDNDPTMPIAVRCRETTLFGHYNTVVNDFNFLELSNTSKSDVSYTFWLSSLLTSEASIRYMRKVPARERADVDVHSLVGPNTFGQIVVMHDGAPGQILARLSQYKVTSTNPLQFSLITSDRLVARSQLAGGH